jgi:hypothetical protein
MSPSGIVRVGNCVTPPVEPATTLEQRREVGVHVPGVSSTPCHLLASRRHFAQCLAVIGDICHDHEYVQPVHVRQVLGADERRARREQSFDRWIIRLIEIEHTSLERAALLKPLQERARLARGDANGDEHDRERLIMRRPRRQTRDREDRKLLAAYQRIEAVDRRDSCLDEVARGNAPRWIDRLAPERLVGLTNWTR